MIKLKELLTESFFVAITPKPRDLHFKQTVGSTLRKSRGKGAGLNIETAEKILKSEIGRNISKEAMSKMKVVATYDEKGVRHGRKRMGPRRYISAITAEVDINFEVSNKTIQVTKNLDMVIGKSQKEVENILKNKYKVRI